MRRGSSIHTSHTAVTRKGDSAVAAAGKNTAVGSHWERRVCGDASGWWVCEAWASGFGDATGGSVRACDRPDWVLGGVRGVGVGAVA